MADIKTVSAAFDKDLTSRGAVITIVKTSEKEKNSDKQKKKSSVKIGKQRTGTLEKTIAVGQPIYFKNKNRLGDYHWVTGPVVSIDPGENNTLVVETENSFYTLS